MPQDFWKNEKKLLSLVRKYPFRSAAIALPIAFGLGMLGGDVMMDRITGDCNDYADINAGEIAVEFNEKIANGSKLVHYSHRKIDESTLNYRCVVTPKGVEPEFLERLP